MKLMAYLAEYNPKTPRHGSPARHGQRQAVRMPVVIRISSDNHHLETVKRTFLERSEYVAPVGIHTRLSRRRVEAISSLPPIFDIGVTKEALP